MPLQNNTAPESIIADKKQSTATPAWMWLCAVCLAIIMHIPDFFLPMNKDSGMFAYGGWRILHGGLPYINFWDNKLPGVFYINAIAMKLFGVSLGGLVVFQMIYAAATACAFFAVAQRFCSRKAAFIGTLIFAFYHGSYGLDEGGNYCECYIALPSLIGILLLLNWSKNRKGYLMPAIAGAMVAIAAIIKQPAGVLIVAMIVFLVFGDKHRSRFAAAGVLLAGVAAVAGIMIGWMACHGMIPEAIGANMVFNRLYFIDAYTYGLDPAKWNIVCGIILCALPFAGAIAGIWILKSRKLAVAGGAWLLITWFILDLFGVAMGGRFSNHYFIGILASALILTSIAIDATARSPKSKIAVLAIGVFLVFGPIWSWKGEAFKNKPYPINSIAQQECHVVDVVLNMRLHRGVLLPSEEIANWIRGHTNSRDLIYVWGWDTRVGFLAQREFCSRYLHTHPIAATGFDREKRIGELARDIRVRRPKYIVDENVLMPTTAPPLDRPSPIPSTCPFFRLDGYEPVLQVVAQYYEPDAVVAGCRVYKRK